MQGICTHVTDVKPHIIVATYTDAETGYEVYQHVTGMASTRINLHLSRPTTCCDHCPLLHDVCSALAKRLLSSSVAIIGRQFNPLDSIPKELQLSTGAKGQLTLETRGSRFMKYQELKMQELAIEVCHQMLNALCAGLGP